MYQGEYHGKQAHDGDIDTVLNRAWAAGVERIMVTAGQLSEVKEVGMAAPWRYLCLARKLLYAPSDFEMGYGKLGGLICMGWIHAGLRACTQQGPVWRAFVHDCR